MAVTGQGKLGAVRVLVTRLLLLALLLVELAPMGMPSAQAALPWGPGDICVSHESGETSHVPAGTALDECCGLPCCLAGMALVPALQLPLPLHYKIVAPFVPVGDGHRVAIAVQSSHQPRAPPVSIVSA